MDHIEQLEIAIESLQTILHDERRRQTTRQLDDVRNVSVVEALGGEDRTVGEWDSAPDLYPQVRATVIENETGLVSRFIQPMDDIEATDPTERLLAVLEVLPGEIQSLVDEGFNVVKLEVHCIDFKE